MLHVYRMGGDLVLSLSQEDATGLTAGALKQRVGQITGDAFQRLRLIADGQILTDQDMLEATWPPGALFELQAAVCLAVNGIFWLDHTRVSIQSSQFVPDDCKGPHYEHCRYTVEAQLPDGGLRVVGGPGSAWTPDTFQIWKLQEDGTMQVQNARSAGTDRVDHVWRPPQPETALSFVTDGAPINGAWRLDDTMVVIQHSQFIPARCHGPHYEFCRYTVEAELPDGGGLRIMGGPGTSWGPDHRQVWRLQQDGAMHVVNFQSLGKERADHIWQPA